jgi:hypothetical protein
MHTKGAHPEDSIDILVEAATCYCFVERAPVTKLHQQPNFVRATSVWRSVWDGLVPKAAHDVRMLHN